MASTVTRIAREKASPSSRAASPARCGRIEVWTAWNNCSGTRTISNTLKTNPARAAPELCSTISTDAFINVCSASMIAKTATAKPLPRRSDRSADASSISAWAGPSPAASSTGTEAWSARLGVVALHPADRERHDDQRHERGHGDARRDGGLPRRDAERGGDREQEPRGRLQQHQPAVADEVLVAGQPPAREVAAA